MEQGFLSGIVRIASGDGSTTGTGFVVHSAGLIATCSHVVQGEAAQESGEPRAEYVKVVFEVSGQETVAKVDPAYWRPADQEDLAILRMTSPVPEGARALPLGSSAGTAGHRFVTFGFPDIRPIKGIHGSGIIAGPTKDDAGNALLQARDATNITMGHSGAPVWDEVKNCVVGMVTALTRPDELLRLLDTAFATPSETIAAVCSELEIFHGLDVFYKPTKLALSKVRDTIGGTVSIPRDSAIADVERVATVQGFAFITGPSGCGKTVVLKKWAQSKIPQCSVLWLEAKIFDKDSFEECERALGLPVALDDALSGISSEHAYLLIDGLDREFQKRVFENLSVILRKLCVADAASPWCVIVTTRDEEFQRLLSALQSHQVLFARLDSASVNVPTVKELAPVWTAYPSLAQLAARPHLHRLLLKPKILDIFAARVAAGRSFDTKQWIGESDLIEWFWSSAIEIGDDRASRDRFLKLLAEKQADELHSQIPAEKFEVPDLTPVTGLCESGICRKAEEKYAFEHDLFGDWARQRILLGRRKELRAFLAEKGDSPLWHRAIRLLALHMLEKESIESWLDVFNSFEPGAHGTRLMQNLILEAPIFAANAGQALEALWEPVLSLDGSMLDRLLGQFLQVATFENLLILALAQMVQSGSRSFTQTLERIPLPAYWPAVIGFLHKHKNEVTKLAPIRVAEVADKWLRYSPPDWPAREEAAELAIELGEDRLGLKMCRHVVAPDAQYDETVFRAALSAAQVDPNRVADFALTASRRKKPGQGVLRATKKYEQMAVKALEDHSKIDAHDAFVSTRRRVFVEDEQYEIPDPWPYGPHDRVDDSFRNVCLSQDGLSSLIEVRPRTAQSVVLGLLIEHPVPRFRFDDDLLQDFSLATEADLLYQPPLYVHPPFSTFLRKTEMVGLELLIRLVDFVTDRWADGVASKGGDVPSVLVTTSFGQREFIGDRDVFGWFRHAGHASNIVSSALMALEKWFYDKMDVNEAVSDVVEVLFKKSRSLAFLGVLCEVGKKHPCLLAGDLLPLLRVPELYFWDERTFAQGESPGLFAWGLAYGQPESFIRLAQKWFQLPHRRERLWHIALQLFTENEAVREYFNEVGQEWRTRLEEFSEGSRGRGFLETLIASFDPSNIRIIKDDEGNTYVTSQPKVRRDEQEILRRKLSDRQPLLTFPWRCRQLLDGTEEIPAEGLEAFWEELQHLASGDIEVAGEWKAFGPVHGLCGGAAVLLKLHREWLRNHKDRGTWCLNFILDTTLNPPNPFALDSVAARMEMRWQGFCSEVLAVLWAEVPYSQVLRECIARLACDKHYDTVRILCQSSSEQRDKLGDSVRQLQHLVLRNAAVRCIRYADWVPDPPNLNVDAWVRRQIDDFVHGRTPVGMEDWKKIAQEVRGEIQPLIGAENCQFLDSRQEVDLHLITAANSWLPDLGSASSQGERTEWIGFWKRMLNYAATMYQECLESRRDFDRANDQWYRWLFARLALIIPGMTPEENPEDLWQPILEVGAEGHYWVESFLSSWFSVNLQSVPLREGFVKEWRHMIEFAFASPSWSAPSGTYYDRETIWCRVMGFGRHWRRLWTADHRSTVSGLRDIYSRWAEQFLASDRCTAKFAAFLRVPAAVDILADGIVWLAVAIREAGVQYNWDEHELGALSALIDYCWTWHRATVSKDAQTFADFRFILKVLADGQNPVAMQILRELAVAR